MDSILGVLRSSVEQLRTTVGGLSDTELKAAAYPAEWAIADVLSHIGSGAVIMQRRLDDTLDKTATPEDFARGVWEEWDAKTARAKCDDALVADLDLLQRIESLSNGARAFRLSMGPLELDFHRFVAMRLNEHALHTWDIEVVIDPTATVPVEAATYLVDNLEIIARFTAKPTGSTRVIAVRTVEPRRDFRLELSPDAVGFEARDDGRQPDLALPAEAFARLVYGRLDPAHTPEVDGALDSLEELRKVFPGP